MRSRLAVVHGTPPSPRNLLQDALGFRQHFCPFVSSAHASTATATASLYFLSALYCSALPPRCIFLHICLWPRRQWSCWQVASQYLVQHLTQRGASWARGAAQAAQVVRIIFGLRWGACEGRAAVFFFRGQISRVLHAASGSTQKRVSEYNLNAVVERPATMSGPLALTLSPQQIVHELQKHGAVTPPRRAPSSHRLGRRPRRRRRRPPGGRGPTGRPWARRSL